MSEVIQDFRTNDVVMTPNGVGVVQGRMYEGGSLYLIIRHVVNDMTQITETNSLTPLAAKGDPRYPTGLWRYEIDEVSHA